MATSTLPIVWLLVVASHGWLWQLCQCSIQDVVSTTGTSTFLGKFVGWSFNEFVHFLSVLKCKTKLAPVPLRAKSSAGHMHKAVSSKAVCCRIGLLELLRIHGWNDMVIPTTLKSQTTWHLCIHTPTSGRPAGQLSFEWQTSYKSPNTRHLLCCVSSVYGTAAIPSTYGTIVLLLWSLHSDTSCLSFHNILCFHKSCSAITGNNIVLFTTAPEARRKG
jgi:hypothetical protein